MPARRPLLLNESTSLDAGITNGSEFCSLTFSAHIVQRLETEADGAEKHRLVPTVVVHPPAVVQLDEVDLPLRKTCTRAFMNGLMAGTRLQPLTLSLRRRR